MSLVDLVADVKTFESSTVTDLVYQADFDVFDKSVTGIVVHESGEETEETMSVYQWCQFRLLKLQAALSRHFINYEHHVEMMLASCIAQEPVLFIGPPGVAKTEMAINFFGGIGLRKPTLEETQTSKDLNKDLNKYFEYLLSPFSVPDELFGTLDFDELQKGRVHRINTNMITGQKVRGVFLDEVFNASSNILNTLLTLINERRYFDDGGFKPADLRVFIGASNHTPEARRTSGGRKQVGELSAFYDRFSLRLYFPTPQEHYQTNEQEIRREYREIVEKSQSRILEKLNLGRPQAFEQVACLNDLLVLGRYLGTTPFPEDARDTMYGLISNFATQRRKGQELCYMSPRKAIKMIPIIYADAYLVPGDRMHHETQTGELLAYVRENKVTVKRENLRVFNHIWDREADRDKLKGEVEIFLNDLA